MTVAQAWNQFLILGQDDIGMRGRAIWRLMSKLYYTSATIRCQQPIALSVGRVYEVCDWVVLQHLISFFAGQFFQTISERSKVLLTLTNDIVCVSVPSLPLQNRETKS